MLATTAGSQFRSLLNRALPMVIVGALAAPASFGAISGTSNGHALGVNVGLVGNTIGVFVGPLPTASGTSPNPYNVLNTTATVTASAAGVADLSTGLLSAHANSNIAANASAGMAAADSTVDDLSLEIVPGILVLPDLVSLSATTIGSHSTVSYDGLTLSSLGGIVIEDAVLSVAGVGNIAINANAAPNTVLLDLLGIRIVLNEQILTTVGDTRSLEVNAIHITIDGALQLVEADVVIAHSFASLTIPSPAGSIALIGPCFMTAMRRRRAR